MKFIPVGTKILIKKLKREPKKGALIMVKDEKDQCLGGVIDWGPDVSLCDEWENTSLHCRIIKYAPYAGMPIDPDDDTLLLIDEKDVLAIVDGYDG